MESFDVLPASKDSYTIVPNKWVPKFKRQYIDTYLVTSGKSYNLQVWNRNPTSDFPQITYKNNNYSLKASDVRFVFGKINEESNTIESIVVTTPKKIVSRFGKFGVPTSKQQLIIPSLAREKILSLDNNTMFYEDNSEIKNLLTTEINSTSKNVKTLAKTDLLSLAVIYKKVKDIVGYQFNSHSTRQKGAELEKLIIEKLGYNIPDSLEAQYPDIPNQLLEVKVQESQTIDLGRYSPQNEEVPDNIKNPAFTTRNIRYLIALTDKNTNKVTGLFIGPGSSLDINFTYIYDKSSKYQRSIPMDFFNKLKGKSFLFK